MIIDDMVTVATTTIKQELERFAQGAEGDLTCELAERATRVIQQAVAAVGRAVFRTFVESKETTAERVVVDGEDYRFKFDSAKSFLTLWGAETFTRRVYQNASDTKSVVPLDRAWGMAHQFLTLEVRESVSFALTCLTPVEAAQFFKKCASAYVPHATQMKHAAVEVAGVLRGSEAEGLARIRATETVPEAVRAVAVSADGANVLMREAGAAKRGRPAERPGLKTAQDETTAYRNAMAGAISFYGAVPEGKKTPQRFRSVYTSHMPEERAPTFKQKFEAEVEAAVARAPQDAMKVVLCDGARALWTYIEGTSLYDDFERLVDFFHTTEHLSLAAQALFGKGTEQAKRWYAKYKGHLLEQDDAVEALRRSMAYYARTLGLPLARRRALETQQTFFARNRNRMAYADFRRRGLPIGSGPVEAACKTLIKARLCQSGMRWTTHGGQNILDLRTYVKSNRWDAMWEVYKQANKAA